MKPLISLLGVALSATLIYGNTLQSGIAQAIPQNQPVTVQTRTRTIQKASPVKPAPVKTVAKKETPSVTLIDSSQSQNTQAVDSSDKQEVTLIESDQTEISADRNNAPLTQQAQSQPTEAVQPASVAKQYSGQTISLQPLFEEQPIYLIEDLAPASQTLAKEVEQKVEQGTQQIVLDDPDSQVDLSGSDADAFFKDLSLAIRNEMFPNSAKLESSYGIWNNRMDYLNLFSNYSQNSGSLISVTINEESLAYFRQAEQQAIQLLQGGELNSFIQQMTEGFDSATTQKEAFEVLAQRIQAYFTYDESYQGATIARCIQDHRIVCEGYARILKMLCEEIGIPCSYVEGYAGNLHAWDQVTLDGEQYWSDLTWAISDEGISQDYLLSANLWNDHQVTLVD